MNASSGVAGKIPPMPRELYGVQSLRGVAALMVVLDHASNIRAVSLLPKWLSVGEAGVDLFFVISGFIMMYVTPRPFRGWRDQAAFLVRRMGRVYPAYWALAFPLLLLWKINPGHVYAHPERHDLIASLFLTPSPVVPIVSVAWTLVFELYFYWVASLIFYAGGALRLMLIAIWFTAIALANLLHPQPWENAWLKVWFCPITFEFIAGMFLAQLLQSRSHSIHVPGWVAGAGIGAAALVGFAAGWRHGQFNIFAPDLVRFFSYGIPAVIVLGLVLKMELQQTWRGVGNFAWLGDRSYSIYLLHLPLMATAITVASRWIHFSGRIENLHIFLVLAGLAIVPIELFYRWVEVPSHVVSRRLAQSVR